LTSPSGECQQIFSGLLGAYGGKRLIEKRLDAAPGPRIASRESGACDDAEALAARSWTSPSCWPTAGRTQSATTIRGGGMEVRPAG